MTLASGNRRAIAVALVTLLILIAAAAFRSSFGVMFIPIESEFGWSRAATSIAVSVNLVFYGLTAPFAAALMERFGIKRITIAALVLMALGTGLTIVMNAAWQLTLLWGVLMGLATGATALVFGSLVAGRWFTSRRGLVMGIFGAAWATGQLVFLPLLSQLVESSGWRYASGLICVMTIALIPIVFFVFADRPSELGLRPFGADEQYVPPIEADQTGGGWAAAGRALTVLRDAARTAPFWILAGTFFVCGWTTNGIISTHFIPATHDHGMTATTAASLLAIVGICDLIGTIGSGWLSDRVDPRILLVIYYGLRGLAFLAMPSLLGPNIDPPIIVVMVFFGLDWVATVPPTVILCQRFYGTETGPIVFGWVFASHMIGAAAASIVTGFIRESTGDYSIAWFLAGALALAAAAAALLIPRIGPRGGKQLVT